MDEPEHMAVNRYTKREIDQYRSFLLPSTADDQDDYYKPIRPTIGPELSVANLEKEDGTSYRSTILFILMAFNYGLDDLAMRVMTIMTAELKMSMSFQARVLDHIFSNKIEYTQKQEVHDYQHLDRRPGFFGRKPPKAGD